MSALQHTIPFYFVLSLLDECSNVHEVIGSRLNSTNKKNRCRNRCRCESLKCKAWARLIHMEFRRMIWDEVSMGTFFLRPASGPSSPMEWMNYSYPLDSYNLARHRRCILSCYVNDPVYLLRYSPLPVCRCPLVDVIIEDTSAPCIRTRTMSDL